MSQFLNTCRAVARRHQLAYSTENRYIFWIKRFILFHNKRHPEDMGKTEIEVFLTALATDKQHPIAKSTQNQALYALLWMYKNVLKINIQGVDAVRTRKTPKLPSVLSQDEIKQFFRLLTYPPYYRLCLLYYGSGLRHMEGVRLRVKDLDFDRLIVQVWAGKRDKHRFAPLMESAVPHLQAQLTETRRIWEDDLAAGCGAVYLPKALEKKYPNAATSWAWQYVFPAKHRSIDPRSGIERRHHSAPSSIQKAVSKAGKELFRGADIQKTVSVHTLRHSAATHWLEKEIRIEKIAEWLGHEDLKTTRRYLHLADPKGSPLSVD